MTSRVRIDPPSQLPSSGITPIKYKQWKVALKIFLHQTPEFREFYPGGKYNTWTALEDDPHRIDRLNPADKPPPTIDNDEHLAQRRIQLETFLGIIARYSDEGDFDDIMEKSTSIDWIFTIHERRYGIQKKGRHFNRIDSIRFDKNTMTDYHKFYTDLRSCYKSNLRKTNDIIRYKNNKVLDQDEQVPPTTECLLVYMALERIDSRLPNEIDRIFGHRMDDSTTLIDLQSEIFSYIPRALASLDRDEAQLNAQHMYQHMQSDTEDHHSEQQPAISAMFSRPNQTRYNRPAPRQQQRQQNRWSNTNKINIRICKLCQALDLPPTVVNSHSTDQCRKKAQLQQLEVEEQISQYQLHSPDDSDTYGNYQQENYPAQHHQYQQE